MPVEIAVALITGGVTILNIFVSALFRFLDKKAQQKTLTKEEMEQRFSNIEDKIVGIETKISYLEDGSQSLLRLKIIQEHEKWTEREYCPIQARESLTRAQKAYHQLGGNDVATALYNDVMELPTEEKDNSDDT